MPAARSPADIFCLALYVLAEGDVLRGFMVQTIAIRLGIDFERAEAMAIAAAEAGLVRHEVHTVRLTGEGLKRGAMLRVPPVKAPVRTPAGRQPSTAPRPRATPRPRRRG